MATDLTYTHARATNDLILLRIKFCNLALPLQLVIFVGQLIFLNRPQMLKYRYDSDFNHAPCLKNGHKAHWALVIGCLIDENDRVSEPRSFCIYESKT